MSNVNDNPCIVCTINQDCCTRLSGLKLTKDEFERHFKGHTEGLVITRSHNMFIVSAKEGRMCPHWENGGCRIHQARPIECRLFPHSIGQVFEKRKKIKIIFHSRTDCPQKHRLLMLEGDARALVLAFGQKVFGEKKPIIVLHEEKKRAAARLRNLIEAALGRLF